MLSELKMIMVEHKSKTLLIAVFQDGAKIYGYCPMTRCLKCPIRFECYTNKGLYIEASFFFGYLRAVIPDIVVYPNDNDIEKRLPRGPWDGELVWDYEFTSEDDYGREGT